MRRLLLACFVLLAGSSLAVAGYAEDDKACFAKTSTPDEGIGACTRLIKSGRLKGNNLAAAYLWRGSFHTRKQEWDPAIADFTEAIRRNPAGASAYNQRGAAYLEKLAFDKAIADFDQAIRLNPRSDANYTNRGYAYVRKGDLERALVDLNQALAMNPRSTSALNNRGLAYAQKGLHDTAILDYDAALRVDPRSYESFINRGIAYREKGDFDRALADFGAAAEVDPRRPNPAFHRGFIARAKGDLGRALAEFNTAAALGAKSPDVFAYRGLTHEALGDLERARADYQSAIAAPPIYVLSPRSQEMARVRLALLSGGNLGAPAPTKEAASGRRVALVIGNAAYAGVTPLANPVNDARAVAAVLRGVGFDVSEGLDLDRDGMQRLIAGFLRDAANARLALIFYAGHGMQIDGRNYLVPVDARLTRGGNPAADMTIVDTVLNGLEDQSRTTIVMLDACRDNPLAARVVASAGSSRSLTRAGLAAPAALGGGATLGAGTLIAFATAPGQVALDGSGTNSPFTAALVRHLGTPGLELQQMLTRVRADVVAATGNRQVPWSNSSLLGEVYLVK
jgi:tetratricopeptide (TPR) repeat protein